MKIISNTYTNEWMQHDDDYTTAILATRYSYTRHSPGIQQGNYLHKKNTLEHIWCDST